MVAAQTAVVPKGRFDSASAREAASRERLAEGVFQAVITGVSTMLTKKESKYPGSFMLVVTNQFTKKYDDIKSIDRIRVKQHIGIPLINEDIADHVSPGFWWDQVCEFLAAYVDPKYGMPIRNKETGDCTYLGKDIDVEDFDACRGEAIDATGPYLVKLWGSEAERKKLLGLACVVTNSHKEGNGKPSNFDRLLDYRAEPRENDEFMHPDDFVVKSGMAPARKSKGKGGNGATGRAKPSKKRKKKGRSRRN